MSDVLDMVIAIASKTSGIPARRLTATSAVYQDLRITGDDVEEFAIDLANAFGKFVFTWPWQRFTDLNEPTMLIVFSLIYRMIRRLWGDNRPNGSQFERLELGHIAAVLANGQWFEP